MVGGQYVDVTAAGKLDAGGLRELHGLKTGRLIAASVAVPLILAGLPRSGDATRTGDSPPSSASCFRSSTTSSTSPARDEELGKPHGSDERHGKLTYVSLFGLERARELAAESHANARASAAEADGETADLELVTDFIHSRQR